MRRTRAAVLGRLHRSEEALAVLDEADALISRIQPDNTELPFSFQVVRAEVLSDAGRDTDARNAARLALKMAPKHRDISAQRWQRIQALSR